MVSLSTVIGAGVMAIEFVRTLDAAPLSGTRTMAGRWADGKRMVPETSVESVEATGAGTGAGIVGRTVAMAGKGVITMLLDTGPGDFESTVSKRLAGSRTAGPALKAVVSADCCAGEAVM